MECRTCLKITDKFQDLFTEDCNLLHKIESISSIQIFVNEQFPSKICDSCVTNVELLYDFCDVVRRSNVILEDRACENGNNAELEDDLIQIDEIKLESESENSDLDDPLEIKKELNENVVSTRAKTAGGKKTVKKKKVFNCADCDFTTENFNLLRTHRIIHKGKQESKTVCNVCGKLIRTCNLTLHMSIHTASPVTCYNCEKVLKNKECLKKHMHLHKKVSIQCTYCEKVFHKRQAYYKHLRRHKVIATTTNDDGVVVEKIPKNTVLGKLSRRRAFESFCTSRNFVITAATSATELADILKDYAFNMRRQDGSDYKGTTLKVLWNTTARDLQDRFLKNYEEKEDLVPIFRRPRIIRDRNNPFEFYGDIDFKIRFRLNKETVMSLLHRFGTTLEPKTRRNKSICARNQVLIALRFYATGAFQALVGDTINVSKSTVCRIIKRVSEQLAMLKDSYIKMPTTEEELHDCKRDFFRIERFPGVIGAIDCIHVKVQSPGGATSELYRNSKGYFSINVQVVCDAHFKVTNIVARWPGSVHDTAIFNDSAIHAEFENNIYKNSYLLGDNSYPCQSFLLTPYLNPQTPSQVEYNRAHVSTRSAVERCFEMVKRRFPCLSVGLRNKAQDSLVVIVACFVLHNIALEMQDEVPAQPNVDVKIDIQPEESPNVVNNNTLARDQLTATTFAVVSA